MSLYNAVFGVNPFAGTLLNLLGISHHQVPRFRDCFLSEDATEIVIYTRTGGGNRDYYEDPERHARSEPESDYTGPFNSNLRAVPGYKCDVDDDFDATYAKFFFAIPEPAKGLIAAIKDLGAVVNPAARWKEVLDKLQA